MNVKEFIKKIDKGEAKVLTVELAKELNGKVIDWMYFGYEGNQNHVYRMLVGEIVSEWEYYKTQPCDGYESRTAYWKTYMNEDRIRSLKNTLLLLDSEGKPRMSCYPAWESFYKEPTFTCSDADREVYFIEVCE